MRIQIISDIHLEFGLRSITLNNPDILVLAGDIHVGTKAIDWIRNLTQEVPILYIMGNHEYYRNSYPKLISEVLELVENTNIHVLENKAFEYEGIAFHGATLWTDFALFGEPTRAGFECQLKLNDYHVVRKSPSFSKLRFIDTLLAHNESLRWLKKSILDSKTERNVVISHHAPSNISIEAKYKSDLVSAGFASNLENFIKETKPELWIHGHVHSCHDYFIGNTRIICNSMGYPSEIVPGFKEDKVITL